MRGRMKAEAMTALRRRARRPLLSIFVATFIPSPAPALSAPNVVPIDANLVTSGQPSAKALAALRAEGFDAVVYLAPFTVPDAVKDEPAILAAQGIEFLHVPIPFGEPNDAEFDR